MNIILLSGGSGKRLWPLSSDQRSKQFLKVLTKDDGTKESMIQRMLRMVYKTSPEANIVIATSSEQVGLIRSQCGEEVNVCIEPCRRDTFGAIALASAFMHEKVGVSKDDAVVVCPVDPYVDESYFKKLLDMYMEAKDSHRLTLMGIEPTYPSAKYGYIIPFNKDEKSFVEIFKEKPDEKTAQTYIEKGALWNGGVFAYSLKYVLNIAKDHFGTDSYQQLFDKYDSIPKISFDYAVVEHEKSIRVIRFSGEWKDLGTWNTVTEAMVDEVAGDAVAVECENTHIINELSIPLVAMGVKNMAIAATADGILVTDKETSSQLKEYIPDRNDFSTKAEVRYAENTELKFGTGGIRAIVGDGKNRLNAYTVRKITQGVSNYILSYIDEPTVVIAYDTRLHSSLFANIAAEVLIANGIKTVIFREPVPTPCLSYTIPQCKCDLGIVITASHNPKEYNGYKVYDSFGCQITDKIANEISREISIIEDDKEIRYIQLGLLDRHDNRLEYVSDKLIDNYISAVVDASVVGNSTNEHNVKIVYSPLNGTGWRLLPRALKKAGYTDIYIVPEQGLPDGEFETCPRPNPELKSVMEYGIRYCKKENADAFIATDPDADRIGVIARFEDDYKLITPNELGILLFDYLCEKRKTIGNMPDNPVFMKTIVTSDMAEQIARYYGVRIVNTLTGFKYIGEQIKQLQSKNDFVFAMEESCGYLSGDYVLDKDGINAALLCCELINECKHKGITLFEKMEKLYKQYGYYSNHQYSFVAGDEKALNEQKIVMDYIRNEGVEKIFKNIIEVKDYRNGLDKLPPSNIIELRFSDGSKVIVRPSGTEPKLKIYVSSISKVGIENANELQVNIKNFFVSMLEDAFKGRYSIE